MNAKTAKQLRAFAKRTSDRLRAANGAASFPPLAYMHSIVKRYRVVFGFNPDGTEAFRIEDRITRTHLPASERGFYRTLKRASA